MIWLIFIYMWYALMLGAVIWAIRFILNPKATIVKWEGKKEKRAVTIAVKALLAVLVVWFIIMLVPPALDIPEALSDGGEKANVTVIAAPTARGTRDSFATIIVKDNNSDEEFKIRIFYMVDDLPNIDDEIDIVYLPNSKFAHIVG